jgi:hypothetical protein
MYPQGCDRIATMLSTEVPPQMQQRQAYLMQIWLCVNITVNGCVTCEECRLLERYATWLL